jgi:DNA polymerase
MIEAHGDFETRSELDLKVVGLHRYARHPSTDVWCMAWALDENEPVIWTPGMPPPQAVAGHVATGGKFLAHNAPFELEIWNEILVKRYGFPILRPQQTYCTMAQCYAMGLPGALDDAAPALGLHVLKDGEGRALMLKYARPWKLEPTRWMNECPEFTLNGHKWTGADGLKRLFDYCKQDVRVERELHKVLMPLSDTERRVWLLDYKINQRGVQLDIPSVKGAIKLAEIVKEEGNAKLAEITKGAVKAVTAVAAFKEWLATRGVVQESLAKQEVSDLLLSTELEPVARQALILRQEVGKASTAKFNVMTDRAGDDGRLRQMYQYHGAGPGRWAGRAVQTHNLPRDMPKSEIVEKVLALVREGRHDIIDMIYGPPLSMVSRCLRSFFIAPPGKKLISGDWSNVEGRGQAWFAGEDWKLKAFIEADAKRGPGIYELAYARMFNVPVESVKNPSEERQVGKVSELAFGYQGGVGSFHTMAKAYPEISGKINDAKADEFKVAWRAAHPRITNVWKEIQKAAINAVRHPGETYVCGHPGRQAKYKMAGSFLWCLLPSGRAICYPYPRILEGEYGPVLTYMTVPSQEDKRKGKIIVDPRNASNWARIGTYGGSLFNNIVQGFCRDFLANGMLILDDNGADIVLHTHDDVNIEVLAAKAEGARKAMEKIMLTPPAWAQGFPLYTKPAIMERYGK